ncbi:MAG: hypothetical protein IJR88_04180 [Clostridia bacterium]|nr:hypothetical protein [Clostridia bacterium]
MKKTLTAILAFFACFALILTLGACSSNDPVIESEETSEVTADNKADCLELLNSFFEETIKSGNFVATSTHEEDRRIESVVGDASCTVNESDGSTFWAFKRGDEFICAVSADGSNQYIIGEDYYNSYYLSSLSSLNVMEYVPEEGFTFQCTVKTKEMRVTRGDQTSDETTATLSFEAKMEGSGSINITATAKNGLVESMVYSTTDLAADQTLALTTTFVYGNAVVTLPDITDWEDVSSTVDKAETDEDAGA